MLIRWGRFGWAEAQLKARRRRSNFADMVFRPFSFGPRLAALIFISGAALDASIVQAQPASQPASQPMAPRGGAPSAAANDQIITPNSLAGAIQNSERTQNADTLLQTYGQAVTTPELARSAIVQLLNDYYQLRNQAQTADQATQAVSEAMLRFMVLQTAQNQIIVQQNQQLLQQQSRIIELLEAQNRNGTPPVRR